jgi:hypothetical protein
MTTSTLTFVGETATSVGDGYAGFWDCYREEELQAA